MKKLILALAFPFCLSASVDPEQKLNVAISSVVVFLEGAEVSHVTQVTLNPGRNKIVFTNISPKLLSKSIQFSASGDISILAVSDRINYLTETEADPTLRAIRDSSKLFSENLKQLQYELEAYQIEKAMLLTNQSIGGNDKGVPIAELKLAADFYRSRIKEINTEILRLEKKITEVTETNSRLANHLAQINADSYKPQAEITILVNAGAKSVSDLQLRYIVSDAGWAPSYDLIAEDVSKPIDLKYRAKVFNNTGIDWTNVKMKLSTSDPMRSASKPQLDPWYLNFVTRNYSYSSNQNSQGSAGYMNNAPEGNSYEMEKKNAEMNRQDQLLKAQGKSGRQMGPVVEYEQIQVSELSAEFDIKLPYSVPADSRPYIVDVTAYTLPATFRHFAVPKIERDAFMLARITGWEDLDLVEGPANVYFGGDYVGQSYIYTRSADDTLDLSFGRDNKVLVTRSKIKDFNKERYIGSSKKETHAFEMVIKNNRKSAVSLDLEDQIPVSQEGEIVVEQIEISKGQLEQATGKITWAMTLQPGESRKIVLSYSVKYPKNKSVNLQRFKKKKRAKF